MLPFEKTFCPYGSFMACQYLPQDKTPGGVILPDAGGDGVPASMGEVQKAKVIAVGPEVRYYKPGDTVFVRNGQWLQHRGQKYMLLLEEETFGCENRDLEPLPLDERADSLMTRKLKNMIFDQASEIIAGMINQGLIRPGAKKPPV